MPQDIRFSVANTPGKIAHVSRALADANINIIGIGCDMRPGEGWGFIHFLVEDAQAAVSALGSIGCEVLDIHDVELVESENRPGSLAEICQRYADSGENIEVLYLGMDNKVVVGTESMRRPMQGKSTVQVQYSDTRVNPEE